ncbi:MAG: hypothetical protein Q7T82_10290 [Armatimonadota bacterium]|nr:hypothetical protein [Armatimonadota bacterium]
MIDFEQELPPEEIDSIIESIAADIVRRRLETPAVLFLETHKPLSFVASQALVVSAPLLGSLFGIDKVSRYSGLLRSRDSIERLIRRIEELVAERDKPASVQPENKAE